MKSVYVIMVCLVVVLSFLSVFFSNHTDEFTSNNLFTGFTIFYGGIMNFDYDADLLVEGDLNSCFVYEYNVDSPNFGCPINTTALLKVGNEFSSDYGSHASYYWIDPFFNKVLCCVGLIGFGGVGFEHGVLDIQENLGSTGGGHVFTYDSIEPTPGYQVELGNPITFSEECPTGYECALKVSTLNNGTDLFNNTHIWICSDDFTENYLSICYQPIPTSFDCDQDANAPDELGIECNDIGIGDGIYTPYDLRLFCSYGPYTDSPTGFGAYDPGHCCPTGWYWWENILIPGGGQCRPNYECGFNSTADCNLPQDNTINPDTHRPWGYFEIAYFTNPGCIKWNDVLIEDEWFSRSCCFNKTQNFATGNYLCLINSTS